QGPSAADILSRVCELDLNPVALPAFSIRATEIQGHKVMLSRSGYTGEDGFEIYVPHAQIEAVWDSLLTAGQTDGLEPVGLGARDT
ncbi:UNVERIFIED_CONTAM: glycine cleavage system aminomethyltransferase GcvT, partial [Salmonella enterica subsp. enterica serovar Weltevreden]